MFGDMLLGLGLLLIYLNLYKIISNLSKIKKFYNKYSNQFYTELYDNVFRTHVLWTTINIFYSAFLLKTKYPLFVENPNFIQVILVVGYIATIAIYACVVLYNTCIACDKKVNDY